MINKYNDETGFTLIEILVVLAIIGVISTSIYNIQLTSWRIWNFNQDQINLQQNGRVVMMKLAKNIRESVDIFDEDIDWPTDQLILRLKDIDNNIYYYKQYVIYDNKLGYRELNQEKDGDDIVNSDIWNVEKNVWPTEGDWGSYKQPLTEEIISNRNIFIYDSDRDLVRIKMKFKYRERNYKLENQIHLRN